jgi:hypothetical protein
MVGWTERYVHIVPRPRTKLARHILAIGPLIRKFKLMIVMIRKRSNISNKLMGDDTGLQARIVVSQLFMNGF